jgi:hypothetical protein
LPRDIPGGQAIEQTAAAMVTTAEELAELSGGWSSNVSLETAAELFMVEPFVTSASTLKEMEKTAVELAGSIAIVQVIVPPAPADGVVQENKGPDVCVSDTNVVWAGTESVNTTFCASSGPLLVTSTL